ncbi:MAG: choice-of-anchor B family protein [Gemmatimonadetes bacterium]|nr:choice-of-anchor B family protein [Gemmatimonadota bacterium]
MSSKEAVVPGREGPETGIGRGVVCRGVVCRGVARRVVSRGLVTVAAVTSVAGPIEAQDRFGAAVRVHDDGQVMVLKSGFGRGPASVHVFERDGSSEWTRRQELLSEGSLLGESFGASIAVVDDGVLVASGDPAVAIGAYGFRRASNGEWHPSESVALGDPSAARAGEISLGAIMAILQPPPRTVAADGDVALVSAPLEGSARTGVVAFERGPDGSWTRAAELEVDGLRGTARYGTALAARGSLAAVGAPGQAGGTVVIWIRGEDGAWTEEARLTSENAGGGSALGSSLAFLTDDELAVGAPRADGSAGRVVHFTRGADGAWVESAVLTPHEEGGGQSFGAALAADENELWIGAPDANEGRGRVDAFTRAGAEGELLGSGTFAPEDLEPGSRFGASVALAGSVAAVGSPGAHGTAGLAAVYEADADGVWSEPRWLLPFDAPTAVTADEVRCEDDQAAGFDCDAVDLQAYLPLAAIGARPGERVSDAWGWTDPQTGREYGLVGRTAGAAIVDVTDAVNPVYLGYIPANPSGARDLKVYRDHLFFTGDGAGAHGLVVFDLTRLRDVTDAPVTFDPDLRWDGIGSAHNLIIDTDAGTAFTVSTSGAGETCGGGLVMIDIGEPLAPEFAGCFTDTEGLIFEGRTHDAQCLVYDGPDPDYQGRELCFASNETALRIVDVTDKTNPIPISAAAYPGVAYIHQGWLTEDGRYFYLNDELDELVGSTDRTKTIVWDVSDLDDPVVVGEHYGPNGSTDHNLYVKGDRMYQANYQAGLRVIDISDPESPVEVGYFDTTPYGVDPPGFNGAWTAFPYFESETVLVTSMLEGVFLLKPRRTELVP